MINEFAELGEFYPGSRERRDSKPALPASAVEEDLLGDGTFMTLRGRSVEFFGIGQVARAIGRRSGTLRAWEDKQIIPHPGCQTQARDPRGVRRLYSRAQAEGIIRLAKECDVMDASSRRPLHEFKTKVWALFNELREAAR